MTTSILRRDGRSIAVHRLAEGSRRTVILAHPAPGSGTFDPGPSATAARDITLLAPDRPGYGGSEPVAPAAGGTIAGAADDCAAVIAAEGGTPVGAVGWSEGGRVVLALAARHPELVDRVAVVATPAPHEEVPWIPEARMALIGSLRTLGMGGALARLESDLRPLASPDLPPEVLLELLGASAADEPDLATPGIRDALLAAVRAGLAPGPRGLAGDILTDVLMPWDLDPKAVQAKVLLVYGSRDPIAAQRHGAWWQRRLPNARLEMTPDAGHLVVVRQWARVLSFLTPNR